jgi:Protein of unknown function (DUF3551)
MRVTMSRRNKTRAVATIAGALLVMTILSSNAAHGSPRYCFNSHGGHHNCGFRTWQQCQATRHGLGGACFRKPGT